jgi:hypothetical protein
MRNYKVMKTSKDFYIPHEDGKFNVKKNFIIKVKVMPIKKEMK